MYQFGIISTILQINVTVFGTLWDGRRNARIPIHYDKKIITSPSSQRGGTSPIFFNDSLHPILIEKKLTYVT